MVVTFQYLLQFSTAYRNAAEERQKDSGTPTIQSVSPLEKAKREAASSAARPKVSGKTVFFSRNDRPYGLKCEAFQTKNALERFTFEKGATRGGGTAPPGPK
ncbi:hypothetical protein QUW15_08220 [Desulfovibrio piger]|nr:hypothetical protein [Desulfovibrio piger]